MEPQTNLLVDMMHQPTTSFVPDLPFARARARELSHSPPVCERNRAEHKPETEEDEKRKGKKTMMRGRRMSDDELWLGLTGPV